MKKQVLLNTCCWAGIYCLPYLFHIIRIIFFFGLFQYFSVTINPFLIAVFLAESIIQKSNRTVKSIRKTFYSSSVWFFIHFSEVCHHSKTVAVIGIQEGVFDHPVSVKWFVNKGLHWDGIIVQIDMNRVIVCSQHGAEIMELGTIPKFSESQGITLVHIHFKNPWGICKRAVFSAQIIHCYLGKWSKSSRFILHTALQTIAFLGRNRKESQQKNANKNQISFYRKFHTPRR